MSTILIAENSEGPSSLERILAGHSLVFVRTMCDAKAELDRQKFDLIIASLHFDESQMFELIREVGCNPKADLTPIICYCSRKTQMARVMHESLEITTRALGAWMYLSEHAYNVYQNPDAELRRVIERCLTEEAREENLQQRVGIQKQREKIQQVRLLLSSQEWSPEMEEYLTKLKDEVDQLLNQVTSLKTSADARRATVESSRDLKDRVAAHVTCQEDSMTDQEEQQSLQETHQSADENQLTKAEQSKHNQVDVEQKQKSGRSGTP